MSFLSYLKKSKIQLVILLILIITSAILSIYLNRFNTPPKLMYDIDNDLAWDYNGHYVDRDGNIVVDCKYFRDPKRFKDNPRKYSLYMLATSIVFDESIYHYPTFVAAGMVDDYPYAPLFTTSFRLAGNFAGGYATFGIPADFNSFYPFNYGYIDMNGDIAIPPIYQGAWYFDNNGYAIVYQETGIGARGYGIINTKGEYLIEPKCDHITREKDGIFKVEYYDSEKGTVHGNVDIYGNITLEE